MEVDQAIKNILAEKGHMQAWVVNQMNSNSSKINMSACKFSAIIHGKRKMSGDEMIAFCKATNTNPDVFF